MEITSKNEIAAISDDKEFAEKALKAIGQEIKNIN
jgi:hypothetical protein